MRDEQGKKILRILNLAFLFCLIYLLLLPLGGYREYRPNIIRVDSFAPVIVAYFFSFGLSTFHLIRYSGLLYKITIVAVLLLFTMADKIHFNRNRCEKEQLKFIAHYHETVVPVKTSCHVLSWHPIQNPDESKLIGKLIAIWKITPSEKMYYNINQSR
jgi:hypothetical protein